jgi:hypothetical protein
VTDGSGNLYVGGGFTVAGGVIANVKLYCNRGQQFGVQRATNLSPPAWTNVNSSPLSPAADGSITFVDTNAPTPAAYYRAFQY